MSHQNTYFYWKGKAWPPSSVLTGEPHTISGTVTSAYPVTVRNAAKLQGYLRTAKTDDVACEVCVVHLNVKEIRDKAGKDVSIKAYQALILPFLETALGCEVKPFCSQCGTKNGEEGGRFCKECGSSLSSGVPVDEHLFTNQDSVLTIWGPGGLIGELRADPSSTTEPLSAGTEVSVTTLQNGPMFKTITVTKAGPLSKDKKRPPVNMGNAFDDFRQGLQNQGHNLEATVAEDLDDWSD